MARAKRKPAVAAKRESLTVTFTGDPRGGRDPEIAEYGGKQFPKGKPVVVDEAWLALNPNLRNNSHFAVR